MRIHSENKVMEFENYSLWDELAAETRPIFLYGTGNGGDKIISALEKYHVKLTGVFASDGFVRDRQFHEYHVRSYSDVVSEYGDDIVVLLAFGTTLDKVKEFIFHLNQRHTLRIPDVPLYGGELFDMEYFRVHKQILHSTAELFADERSVALFYDAINFRLTGKLEYLTDTESTVDTLSELFAGQSIDMMVDGGAFKGDSAAEYIDGVHPKTIIAAEADPKTFVKLSLYAESEKRSKVIPVNAALLDRDGETEYVSSGSRGSGKDGQNHRANAKSVPCRRLDTIVSGSDIDLIKLDVEGAETSALIGARETILRCNPNLAVSLYHKTDDVFSLVQYVHELLPSHRLYLRRVPCIPMWDLNLFAVR